MIVNFFVILCDLFECIWDIGWIAFFLYCVSVIPAFSFCVLVETVFNLKINEAWVKRIQGLITTCLTMCFTYYYLSDNKPSMVLTMIVIISVVAVTALLCDLTINDIWSKKDIKNSHSKLGFKNRKKAPVKFSTFKTGRKKQSQKVENVVTLPFDLEPRVYSVHGELLLPTLKGDFVRSLNEQLIADSLYQAGISYQYEKTIVLEKIECHPDFTVVHPTDGKLLYWEHCGMMNIPEYRSKWERKKKLYERNNIVEGENLIITYNQISKNQITTIIESYFI